MPEITKADLSRLVGVSKAAVSKAVTSHHVVVTADGLVDTDLPSNAAWIAAKRAGIRQANKPAPRQPKGDTVSPPPPDEDDIDDPDDAFEALLQDSAEKTKLTRARRLLAEHDTQLRALSIAQKKGDLIPREFIRRRYSAFDAALKTHLRDLPRRTAARLHAIAVSEGPRALETALEEEISQAIARVVESAKDQCLE